MASRQIRMPYADPLHNHVWGGQVSYYLQQWRAYMDTWPVSRFFDCLGVNFKELYPYQQVAVAQLLAGAGFTHARVELGWGGFDYNAPSQPTGSNVASWTKILTALKSAGIRPLVLLNTNSISPCPSTTLTKSLTAVTNIGDTQITLSDVAGIIPGKTGLSDLAQSSFTRVASPLITAADATSGICTL